MNIEEKYHLLLQEIKDMSIVAKEYFDSDDFDNQQKGDGSVVTRIDTEIESRLRTFIETHFPDDSIIGEEHADTEGVSGYQWHIDPIDGTDNFLRKIPFCAISVARLGDTTQGSFGIVHNPITNHTFASFMSTGAYENERITNMTAEPLGGKYTISLGCGRETWMGPAGKQLLAAVAQEFGRGKAYGSTALELAYLSAGRIDGFITFGLNTYDYGAGLYLVKAAGGMISVFENDVWSVWEGSIKDLCDAHGKTIFASHPDVHQRMTAFIGNPKKWGNIPM